MTQGSLATQSQQPSHGFESSSTIDQKHPKFEMPPLTTAREANSPNSTMATTLQEHLSSAIAKLEPESPQYATEMVDLILTSSRNATASDVHLLPTQDGLQMLWRLDGVLHQVAELPREVAPNIVARLKVLAELLTYQTDVPQEGRIRVESHDAEMRVSTFPTLYGEKAVIRLFVGSGRYRFLDDLQLPDDVATGLRKLLMETGGVILIAGPAGSGKTTTNYACLRELVNEFGNEKSLVSLEDPIEAVVERVAQSQINANCGFDYTTGLRSLMRQDPDVIMVGEIRDKGTAETVFQASLTGHLVITTFHAGSAAGAVSRLSDMGIEPYLLRSGILGIICQRLVRRLCSCSIPDDEKKNRLGLDVDKSWKAVGCEKCGGTGYTGRSVLAELLLPDLQKTGRAILSRSDAAEIEAIAVEAGMETCWKRALEAVESGMTSPVEVRRVLGLR